MWVLSGALVAYGALKFGVKRELGSYDARAKQKAAEAQALSHRVLHGK
jgi:hypothetical protein